VADQLTLGMLGGTGPQGRGLTLRLAAAGHRVLLGSRNADRAASVVAELVAGRDLPVRGVSNHDAAGGADIVFLVFPFEGQVTMLPSLAEVIGDKVVVDVINPLGWDERGAFALDVPEGSAAEQAQALLPRARVVSAFHHAPPRVLADMELACDTDVLVAGDDPDGKAAVIELADQIPGSRGIDAGPLRQSRQLEGFTAVVVSVNRRYRVNAGVRITRLSEERRQRVTPRPAETERSASS
jgi:8-hydroxy-5-deazaflavin:NADPH oxidoreductase